MINLTLSQVSQLMDAQAYMTYENSASFSDECRAVKALLVIWADCLAVEKQYQEKRIGVGQLRKQVDVLRDALKVRTLFGDKAFVELFDASRKTEEWESVSVTELYLNSANEWVPFEDLPEGRMLRAAGKQLGMQG